MPEYSSHRAKETCQAEAYWISIFLQTYHEIWSPFSELLLEWSICENCSNWSSEGFQVLLHYRRAAFQHYILSENHWAVCTLCHNQILTSWYPEEVFTQNKYTESLLPLRLLHLCIKTCPWVLRTWSREEKSHKSVLSPRAGKSGFMIISGYAMPWTLPSIQAVFTDFNNQKKAFCWSVQPPPQLVYTENH